MSEQSWKCYMCKHTFPITWAASLKKGHRFCSGKCIIDLVQRKRLVAKIKDIYTHSIVNEEWSVNELRQRLCALKIEKKY
jgi:hypothetical protein